MIDAKFLITEFPVFRHMRRKPILDGVLTLDGRKILNRLPPLCLSVCLCGHVSASVVYKYHGYVAISVSSVLPDALPWPKQNNLWSYYCKRYSTLWTIEQKEPHLVLDFRLPHVKLHLNET